MSEPEVHSTQGLRQRKMPPQATSAADAREAVLEMNTREEKNDKPDGERKTFGRTPDGTVFTVPVTHDMVSQLLSPSEPKNVSDALVLTVLGFQISLLWILPVPSQVFVLGALFIFWRASYNLGIGWLLQKQSKQLTLVRWARKSKLFGKAQDATHPRLRAFIKSELERKVARDYSFDSAPLEYNTWLVFRRIVDLILMCDFCSYMLFAVACAGKPEGELFLVTIARWTVGMALLLFNLWVKLDAHRVVKDYAWYWGDFFFLVDQDLTFDGVFEMAPHPMYSIGYIGYYGISLMAASHKVMFISIFAHAAQFAFLVLVENPHIEKTYNAPPSRRQLHEVPQSTAERPITPRVNSITSWPKPGINKPLATHNLVGPQNFDFYRITDTSTCVIQVLLLLLTLATPTDRFYQSLFMLSAILSRLWYSVGIGYLLNRQSVKKKWTRHFLKHGESTNEAWRQWQGMYYVSMNMCYATFIAAAWKMYKAPESWDDGTALLKHTIGFGLIALQLWVAVSVYQQLGEFGWFFGDFFFDHSPKLTYGGIYRFLNNPERVLGLAGVWGVALITNTKSMFALALLSHTLSFGFIQLVERPHMQKLYGRHLRQDSGLVKTLKRSLPPPLRHWQDGMDKMLDEALDVFEEWLDARKPQFGGSTESPKETVSKQSLNPTRSELATHAKEYSISIDAEHTEVAAPAVEDNTPMIIAYGSPIHVKWTASTNHDKLDWIGVYDVSRNSSREVTRVSSQGRWTATNPGEYDVLASEDGLVASDVETIRQDANGQPQTLLTGEMIFTGDKLWWEQGVYEFRYHQGGKHTVMAISPPFEIRIPRISEDDLDSVETLGQDTALSNSEAMIRKEIEKELLPVVQKCFERDPDIAPNTPQELFGGLVEREGKYARRVVYAIQHMFGIEFAPQVVKADGKIENLAWRIWEAKKVLAPYSMSKSRGTSTPI